MHRSGLPAPGDERTVEFSFEQREFDAFARITGDRNPIHVDAGFAATTRFGTTVAHGMLLFSRLYVETRRWTGGRALGTQYLMFPAPTPANVTLTARLRTGAVEPGAATRIEHEIATDDGTVTATGEATLGVPAQVEAAAPPSTTPPSPAAAMRGLRLGDRAEARRAFSDADVAEWRALVGDDGVGSRVGHPEVPQPLLCGLVSCLLGIDLPGPGTNWLKARFRFLRPVSATSQVAGSVEVVRLRPDKDLVDLATTLVVEGEVAVDGTVLVLYRGDRSTG